MSKINSFLWSLQSKKDTNKNKSWNIDDIFWSSWNTKDNSHLWLKSFCLIISFLAIASS